FSSAGDVHCTVCYLDRLFGQSRKLDQEFFTHRNCLVWLTTSRGDLARDADIDTIPIGPVERITRKSPTICMCTGHNHSAIETARKRHCDRPATISVAV